MEPQWGGEKSLKAAEKDHTLTDRVCAFKTSWAECRDQKRCRHRANGGDFSLDIHSYRTILEFLVKGSEFLVAGVQLFLGRLEFFVGALKFLVCRQDLFVGGFEFLKRGLVLLDERLELFLELRHFPGQALVVTNDGALPAALITPRGPLPCGNGGLLRRS